jgi:hypothetical protein
MLHTKGTSRIMSTRGTVRSRRGPIAPPSPPRGIALVLPLAMALAACGGAPPAASRSVPPPSPPLSAPPPPPAAPLGPVEPKGLSVLTPPEGLCTVTGVLDDKAIELTTTGVGGRNFAFIDAAPAKLILGPDGAFAEIATAVPTVRGFVTRPWVRTRRWMPFGGVYFPGVRALRIRDLHDGKIHVEAEPDQGFAFTDTSSAVAEIPCADLTLTTDPDGTLISELPPLFRASGRELPRRFKGTEPIPISEEPGGPERGTLAPWVPVVVLEQRGGFARVRADRAAGWVDARRVGASRSAERREPDMADVFRAVGAATDEMEDAEEAYAGLTCSTDVRVVAESVPSDESLPERTERFVVGTIPAGRPVRVADAADDLAFLIPSAYRGVSPQWARLAVPIRDLETCKENPVTSAGTSRPLARRKASRDAIDELEREAALVELGGDLVQRRAMRVTGALSPEDVERTVARAKGIRECYASGDRSRPKVSGRISVNFVVDETGAVENAVDGGSDLPDRRMVACVVSAVSKLSFPAPESGRASVVCPILFSPGAGKR